MTFTNPDHSCISHRLSGGCVHVCASLGRVCCPDKRAITLLPLWSLSLRLCGVKAGVCSWLADHGVGHLGLNSRSVCRACVTTSWEGSCFSWDRAALCTAVWPRVCLHVSVAGPRVLAKELQLRKSLNVKLCSTNYTLCVWIQSVEGGRSSCGRNACVCLLEVGVCLQQERNLLICLRK